MGLSNVVGSLPYQELSEEETAGLIQMREEEKLARDVYQVLGEKWQAAIFSNIAVREQRHMDAVKSLLDKYDIDDPVTDSTAGVFTDPELQALFEQLTAKGNESLVAALQVGNTVEDLDIYDLEEFIAQADNEDIKTVYQNLLKGSRNHLRAFWYQLSLNGGEYEAQYISAEELAAIVTSDRERGRVDADGNVVEMTGAKGKKGKGTGECQRLSLNNIQPGGYFLLARHGGGGHGHGNGGGNSYRHNNQHRYKQQNNEQHQYKGKGKGYGPKDGTGNGPGTGEPQNSTEAS